MWLKSASLVVAWWLCGHLANAQTNNELARAKTIYYRLSVNWTALPDTFFINRYVDSIAAENNPYLTDFATVYGLVSKQRFIWKSSRTNYFQQREGTYTTLQTPVARSLFKFYLGESCWLAKDVVDAFDLQLEALNEMKAIGFERVVSMGELLAILSANYYNYDYRACLNFGLEAEKYPISTYAISNYNTVGLAYQKLGVYDSAIYQFGKARYRAKTTGNTIWYSISSGNLGRTYCLLGKYEKGIAFLKLDARLGQKEEPVNSALSAVYVADAFLKLKKPDSALHYINWSRQTVQQTGQWNGVAYWESRYCYFYYEVLAATLYQMGRYRQAFLYLDSAAVNRERFRSQYDWSMLNAAEKRIDNMTYRQQLELVDERRKNQQLRFSLAVVALVAMLAVLVFIIHNMKLRRKRERALSAERETNLLLQQQNAENELQAARIQLADLLEKFEERASTQDEMVTGFRQIASSNPDVGFDANAMKALTRLSETTLLTNHDWEQFQSRFERVYPGFFDDISHQVPNLTPAEERMLALLKLKISNRQMARMLGIAQESVRTAKYRLRKKLVAANQTELLQALDEWNRA